MALNIQGTPEAAEAWAPNKIAFKPEEVIPEALILKASTVVDKTLRGDNPSVLVPWVNDADANWAYEHEKIETTSVDLSQVAVHVRKIVQIIPVSNELWSSETFNADMVSNSSMRAITNKANAAFVSAVPDEKNPLIGIANTPGVITGGTITKSLDPLADAVAQIEANRGTPTVILANPLAWGKLRTLKAEEGSNTSLLGAGTEDQGKKLFGIEVITSPAVPEGKLVVVDSSAIASVLSELAVDTSEHILFDYDSTMMRVILTLGWAVQYPDRIAVVSVESAA